MKLEKVFGTKIYIKYKDKSLIIDIKENQLLEVVRLNNFSRIELELFLKEYNKGIEMILGEKITPEYSMVKIDAIGKVISGFEKDYQSIKKKIDLLN